MKIEYNGNVDLQTFATKRRYTMQIIEMTSY